MNQDINIVVMELDIGEISNHNIFILCKRRFHIMLYEAAKVQSNLLVRNRFLIKTWRDLLQRVLFQVFGLVVCTFP
jgi:hypothetical protein